ncbi:MAG: hypothetical protein ABIE70_03430 [bacterium]
MTLSKVGVLLAVLLLALPAVASDQKENFSPINRDRVVPQIQESHDVAPGMQALDGRPTYWEGGLRVYVVEKVTSMGWNDNDGHPYEFPFLAFAINSAILLDETTWDTTVTWDGYDFNYNNLQEGNIAVQAVLFSQADGRPEAAAMAEPGIPGSNVVGPGYTHTVFAEEGTATW